MLNPVLSVEAFYMFLAQGLYPISILTSLAARLVPANINSYTYRFGLGGALFLVHLHRWLGLALPTARIAKKGQHCRPGCNDQMHIHAEQPRERTANLPLLV